MKNSFGKECEYCAEKFEDIFIYQDITNQKIITHIIKCEEKQTSKKILTGLDVFLK